MAIKQGVVALIAILLLVGLVLPTACANPSPAPAPASSPKPAPAPSPAPASASSPKPAPAPSLTPAPAPSSKPAAIVLKVVSYRSAKEDKFAPFKLFMDKVNQKAKGEMTINYLGGPEVFAPPAIGTAVKNGVVDIGWVFGAAYKGLVKEAEAMKFSKLTVEQERQRGLNGLVNEFHKPAGLYWLGLCGGVSKTGFFYLFTAKLLGSIKDLSGKRVITPPVFTASAPAFGMTPTKVDDAEIYPALERGLADAHVDPIDEIYPVGLHQVLHYAIDHPFLYSGGTGMIVNLNTWNKLSPSLQNVLREAQREAEDEGNIIEAQQNSHHIDLLKKSGMQFIKFSSADEKTWYDTINKIEPEAWLKTLSPETIAKFKNIGIP